MPEPAMERVSNEIAQLYKQRYGRGPVHVRSLHLRDVVCCVLFGANTPVHTALIDDGRTDLAQAVHAQLQIGIAEQLKRIVERATDRTVTSYIPGFNADDDVTTDVFVLKPIAVHTPPGDLAIAEIPIT